MKPLSLFLCSTLVAATACSSEGGDPATQTTVTNAQDSADGLGDLANEDAQTTGDSAPSDTTQSAPDPSDVGDVSDVSDAVETRADTTVTDTARADTAETGVVDTSDAADVPEDVGDTERRVKQVASSTSAICLLYESGVLRCWGMDTYGEVSPPKVKFKQIAGGYYHFCGILETDELTCWGSQGVLDGGSLGMLEAPSGTFQSVSVGHPISCGVRTNGMVTCWGPSYPPSDFYGHFTQVAAGSYWACGLQPDRTIACWGEYNDYSEGVQDGYAGAFDAIAAYDGMLCMLDSDGYPGCISNFEPMLDDPSEILISLAVGPGHACGLRPDHTVFCWGDEYGAGESNPPAGAFEKVFADAGWSCGLADGQLTCWGADLGWPPEVNYLPTPR